MKSGKIERFSCLNPQNFSFSSIGCLTGSSRNLSNVKRFLIIYGLTHVIVYKIGVKLFLVSDLPWSRQSVFSQRGMD